MPLQSAHDFTRNDLGSEAREAEKCKAEISQRRLWGNEIVGRRLQQEAIPVEGVVPRKCLHTDELAFLTPVTVMEPAQTPFLDQS